jgi:hypothetical protein
MLQLLTPLISRKRALEMIFFPPVVRKIQACRRKVVSEWHAFYNSWQQSERGQEFSTSFHWNSHACKARERGQTSRTETNYGKMIQVPCTFYHKHLENSADTFLPKLLWCSRQFGFSV